MKKQDSTSNNQLTSSISKEFRGVYVLRMNLNGAGFGAVLLQTLNQIRYCERNNLMPVVNYDESCNSYFFDKSYGNNMWSQYFEPLIPSYDFPAIGRLCDDSNCSLNWSDLINLDDKKMLEICEHDINSIYTFPFADWRFKPPENLEKWYNEQRNKGRETFSKYIRIKPSILSKINDFRKKNLEGYNILGIHIRGTDLSYAPPVSPAEYFFDIDNWISSNQKPKLFVATDQQQYLSTFKDRYGEIVVSYDSSRSVNEIAPFNLKSISPYKKGEDVLMDMYLLSCTDFLIKGTSAVSELALYINPKLKCLDLSLNKRYAFGQDYGKGWNGGVLRETKPAWLLVNKTNLSIVSDNAKKQTAWQGLLYKYRPIYSPIMIFYQRAKNSILKRLGYRNNSEE
ncbi:MAG: hypothetical protein HWE07_13240 [Cytophagia bacterium]|nr:hypothetical protein [Cytophagia bacterium]